VRAWWVRVGPRQQHVDEPSAAGFEGAAPSRVVLERGRTRESTRSEPQSGRGRTGDRADCAVSHRAHLDPTSCRPESASPARRCRWYYPHLSLRSDFMWHRPVVARRRRACWCTGIDPHQEGQAEHSQEETTTHHPDPAPPPPQPRDSHIAATSGDARSLTAPMRRPRQTPRFGHTSISQQKPAHGLGQCWRLDTRSQHPTAPNDIPLRAKVTLNADSDSPETYVRQ